MAYLEFKPEEIGEALSREEMVKKYASAGCSVIANVLCVFLERSPQENVRKVHVYLDAASRHREPGDAGYPAEEFGEERDRGLETARRRGADSDQISGESLRGIGSDCDV